MAQLAKDFINSFKLDFAAIFNRIKLTPDVLAAPPSLDHLSKVIFAFMSNIPFENIDTHSSVPITFNMESIFDKQITRKRGGFCFELISMLSVVLHHLHYDYEVVKSRVYVPAKDSFLAVYTHTALVVKLEGKRYLVDSGFGEGSACPILLEEGAVSGGDASPDGYRYRAFPSSEYAGHWYYERESVGLPGLGNVLNEPGVWEKRILWEDKNALASDMIAGVAFVTGDNGKGFVLS
jgi:arylamine N-acetyltransferase